MSLRRPGGAALLLLLWGCARPIAVGVPPRPVVGYEETGKASWYGHPYHGRRTASGEIYDMTQMTAAHRTLPFGSLVLVENQLNGRTAEVRITDRGPFVDDRILDLSYAAARMLGAVGPGVIPVQLRVLALAGEGPVARSGAFAVQVASFASEYRASVLKEELDRRWRGAYVQRAEVAGQVFYRVRLGSFQSRAEAERLAQRLASDGYRVLVLDE
jgi:rare lipoprotein A